MGGKSCWQRSREDRAINREPQAKPKVLSTLMELHSTWARGQLTGEGVCGAARESPRSSLLELTSQVPAERLRHHPPAMPELPQDFCRQVSEPLRAQTLGPDYLASHLSSVTHKLCELGQIT